MGGLQQLDHRQPEPQQALRRRECAGLTWLADTGRSARGAATRADAAGRDLTGRTLARDAGPPARTTTPRRPARGAATRCGAADPDLTGHTVARDKASAPAATPRQGAAARAGAAGERGVPRGAWRAWAFARSAESATTLAPGRERSDRSPWERRSGPRRTEDSTKLIFKEVSGVDEQLIRSEATGHRGNDGPDHDGRSGPRRTGDNAYSRFRTGGRGGPAWSGRPPAFRQSAPLLRPRFPAATPPR
jgi:hypothetical protein